MMLLVFSLIYTEALAVETNSTKVEIIITISGMQETVASLEKSAQQITALTKSLSTKKEFTTKDHELITNLTLALNNNANAINKIATAIPSQFEKVEKGINNIIGTTSMRVQDVIRTSKDDFVDPTLQSIENKVLIFILIVSLLLFGLLWYGLWKIRMIVSTGSETVENIMKTVNSLQKVLEKIDTFERST